MAADKYEVGYCKPPKKSRFKKGQSGNPKGRPKGSPNLLTAVRRAQAEHVLVTENGRHKSISKLDAAAIQMVNKAVKGDPRSYQQLTDANERLEQPANVAAALSAQDEKIIEDIVRRIRASKPSDEGK